MVLICINTWEDAKKLRYCQLPTHFHVLTTFFKQKPDKNEDLTKIRVKTCIQYLYLNIPINNNIFEHMSLQIICFK